MKLLKFILLISISSAALLTAQEADQANALVTNNIKAAAKKRFSLKRGHIRSNANINSAKDANSEKPQDSSSQSSKDLNNSQDSQASNADLKKLRESINSKEAELHKLSGEISKLKTKLALDEVLAANARATQKKID